MLALIHTVSNFIIIYYVFLLYVDFAADDDDDNAIYNIACGKNMVASPTSAHNRVD
jgi:hypothetical protein